MARVASPCEMACASTCLLPAVVAVFKTANCSRERRRRSRLCRPGRPTRGRDGALEFLDVFEFLISRYEADQLLAEPVLRQPFQLAKHGTNDHVNRLLVH